MATTTLELSDEEVTLLRHALRHYLSEFGHNEAYVLREAKQLLAKLPQAAPTPKAG